VMRGLLDTEETNKQYGQDRSQTVKSSKMEVDTEEPTAMATSKSDDNSTKAKGADEGEKQKAVKTTRYSGNKFRNNQNRNSEDNKPGTSRWYNDKNINTMVAATKMVSEGKFKNLEEAVRNIQCATCNGKFMYKLIVAGIQLNHYVMCKAIKHILVQTITIIIQKQEMCI